MPRFEDAHIACLRRTMATRLPDCLFTREDVQAIVADTGLGEAQIDQWAKHFRARYEPEQREEFLRSEKDSEVR